LKARLVCMDGEVIVGETETSSLSRLRLPVVPDGSAPDEPAWMALGAIRQVELLSPPAPGTEDPPEAQGLPKVVVRFLGGEELRTYRDDASGQDGDGFRMLRWNR